MAVQIEEALEDDGLQVWLDHLENRLGALLRRELQTAIKNSHILILLWSKAAAKSRWVAAEVLTAFHLDRFIVACVYDNTPLPYFLQNTIHLNLQGCKAHWGDRLRRAVRESPGAANEIPTLMSRQEFANSGRPSSGSLKGKWRLRIVWATVISRVPRKHSNSLTVLWPMLKKHGLWN